MCLQQELISRADKEDRGRVSLHGFLKVMAEAEVRFEEEELSKLKSLAGPGHEVIIFIYAAA